MDVNSVPALLSSIKTAMDLASSLKGIDATLKNAEHKMKVAELLGALAEVKMVAADLQQEILDRDQKLRDLEARLALRGSLIYDDSAYWLADSEKRDGPYCAKCKDDLDKLVRLYRHPNSKQLECKTCKSYYQDKHYIEPIRGPMVL